jgi:hypothetical protein
MLMLPIFMIPLVGLAVDGTMLYIVQTKLQSAADGAALGSGRLLGTKANIPQIAGEFVGVNFPVGFWGAANLVPSVEVTHDLGVHTIKIHARVDVPLLFMRVLGKNASRVTAEAVATRRDTRVVLVLDRSGSMDNTDPVSGLNVFTTMKACAKNFVGMFTPGTDELGLVVFGSGGLVAYPTARPYNPSPTGAGGPDTSFAVTPTTGPVVTQINALLAGGGTNIPEALSLAYIELQKAHNREIALRGNDYAMNAIVLFTDGRPTALSLHPNDRTALPDSNAIGSGSPCTHNPETADAATQMRGGAVIHGGSPPWGGASRPIALFRLSAYDTSQTLTWWLGHPNTEHATLMSPSSAVSGCNQLGRNDNWGLGDLYKIPDTDLYGNSTNGAFYHLGGSYNGTSYNPNLPNNEVQLGLAIWNAVDNVGRTIRSQATMNPVAIYTIGYTGNGGIDPVLLKRLANTPDITGYDPTQQTGMFVEVHRASDLSTAFSQVASEVLRLAK